MLLRACGCPCADCKESKQRTGSPQQFVRRANEGLDLPAARRHFVNHRHVEIAVQRQGERARDGCGGHHEDVRMQPFGSQHGALQDTEAMLLVDDHQAELPEPHVTLDERVGADHQLQGARLHLRELFRRYGLPDQMLMDNGGAWGRTVREFPTDDWRRRESDLLYEIPFRADDGVQLTLVCVLIEHQSEPDPLIPLRTLLYALFFWERQWKDWEQAKPPKTALRLWPVVPLVLHTGPRRWGSNRELADLIDGPDAVRAFAPRWQPLFWDLADHSAKELASENDDVAAFGPVFEDAVRALNPLYNTDRTRWYDMLRTVVAWAERRRPKPERQKWLEAAEANQPTPEQKSEVHVMSQTIGEAILEEGMVKGAIDQTRRLLLRTARKRFGEPDQVVTDAINAITDLGRLEALYDRIEFVASWSELLQLPS